MTKSLVKPRPTLHRPLAPGIPSKTSNHLANCDRTLERTCKHCKKITCVFCHGMVCCWKHRPESGMSRRLKTK
jgi:hypothetical protein